MNFNDEEGNKNLFGRYLVIENIGQGTATEFKITLKDEMGNLYKTDDVTSMGKDTKEIYRFLINKDFIKVEKYKIIFDYEDILRKEYFQEVEFEIVGNSSQPTGFNLGGFVRTFRQQESEK